MHRLICDNDGRWYVIPVGREAEFHIWAETQDEERPEWIEPVYGSPTRVSFLGYRIG